MTALCWVTAEGALSAELGEDNRGTTDSLSLFTPIKSQECTVVISCIQISIPILTWPIHHLLLSALPSASAEKWFRLTQPLRRIYLRLQSVSGGHTASRCVCLVN